MTRLRLRKNESCLIENRGDGSSDKENNAQTIALDKYHDVCRTACNRLFWCYQSDGL